MSLSQKYKAYTGDLSFAEWKALYLRLEKARAARGAAPKVQKARVQKAAVKVAQAPKFERVSHRVDCFAVKGGKLSMAADTSDLAQIKRIIGSACIVGQSYTSKRGERTRFTAPANVVAKLERKGFAVKGL